MVVLVTCQNEEEPIKNEGARVLTTLCINFFRRKRADYSGVGGGIWPKIELIQALMHVLVTYRMRMIELKMEELECLQDFSHYKSMGIFPDAQGQLTPQLLGPIWSNFKLVRDVMDVLLTCKYEKDPFKNEGARVFTTFSPL